MKPSRLLLRGLLLALVLPLISMALHAAAIDLSIVNPNRIGAAGDVFTFQGTITNNTGAPLDSTELFLNFSAYDPVNVTLDQLLGLTGFTIPDGTTSAIADLFTFTLGTTAGPGTYPADVVLQTAAGDIADPRTVTVTIVPEPDSLALMALCCPCC